MFGLGGPVNDVVNAGLDIFTLGGTANARAQEQANAMNMKMANKQMKFQERMSNTAYQRGMKDMEAAGLNPMLAFSQGGASTPTGSMANIQAVDKGAAFRGAADTLMKGIQARNTNSATDLNKASKAKSEQDTKVGVEEEKLRKEQAAKTKGEGLIVAGEAVKQGFDIQSAAARARKEKNEADVSDAGKKANMNAAKIRPYLGMVNEGAGATAKVVEAAAKAKYRFAPSKDSLIDKHTGVVYGEKYR